MKGVGCWYMTGVKERKGENAKRREETEKNAKKLQRRGGVRYIKARGRGNTGKDVMQKGALINRFV